MGAVMMVEEILGSNIVSWKPGLSFAELCDTRQMRSTLQFYIGASIQTSNYSFILTPLSFGSILLRNFGNLEHLTNTNNSLAALHSINIFKLIQIYLKLNVP